LSDRTIRGLWMDFDYSEKVLGIVDSIAFAW